MSHNSDDKVTTLPDGNEILIRLREVDDDPNLVHDFYPRIAKNGGMRKSAAGVALMFITTIQDLVNEGYPPSQGNSLHELVPRWLYRLIDDSKVLEEAKEFHRISLYWLKTIASQERQGNWITRFINRFFCRRMGLTPETLPAIMAAAEQPYISNTSEWHLARRVDRGIPFLNSSRLALENLGFKILRKADNLFYAVQPPKGWQKQTEGNRTVIVDEKGLQRIVQYHKDTLFDPDAYLYIFDYNTGIR
ncbi:hypothetical protein A2899_02805 [Candidatus Amesbacteria bacterium RIFCSPLOWO2_01_FULL_49_25]|nr:MAG: hypothetical protein A2899_02805 [Candidatus Amesbacteria bacterium RIFCSPLOWO2_01_FULL_49_25]